MRCPNCGNEMPARRRDYRYMDVGLRNVTLKNLTVYECKRCREILPEISNVKDLHQQIAEIIINKPSALSGKEFRFVRKWLQMSAVKLAQMLGVTTVTLSRWENGKEKVGSQSDRLLRCLYLAKTSPRKGYVFKTFQDVAQGIVTRAVKTNPISIPALKTRQKAPLEASHHQ